MFALLKPEKRKVLILLKHAPLSFLFFLTLLASTCSPTPLLTLVQRQNDIVELESSTKAPTGVQVFPGNTEVTVSWNLANDATGYNLYFSHVSGAGTSGTKISNVLPDHVISGLTNGTTYYLVVTAVGTRGETPASNQVSTTPWVTPPTGLVATGEVAKIKLNWNLVGGATSYNLYYSTTAGVGTGGTKVNNVYPGYALSNLPNGTACYLVVTAVDIAGESTASTQAAATPMGGLFSFVIRTSAGSRNWWSVASSSDGSHLAAVVQSGDIYASDDYGVTWTDRSSAGSRLWYSIASSSDGSHLAAVVQSGDIYTSNDFGSTWTDRSSAGSRVWCFIASSSDGSHLAAIVQGGDIYTSGDYGATWIDRTSAGSRAWRSITSSSDGSHLAAVDHVWGDIYASADFGATWIDRTSTWQQYWNLIVSSSDGSHIAAVSDGFYTSNDYGLTWANLSSAVPGHWYLIASSSDGSQIAAAISNGDVYTSSDYGVTWSDQPTAGSRNWSSIFISSDGSRLSATVNGGYIYTGE